MERLTAKDAAAQVAAEAPPVGDWPDKGVTLNKGVAYAARKASWPGRKVIITVHHPEGVDSAGWHRPARTQDVEVVVYPALWVKRLAELMGCPVTDLVLKRIGYNN